MQVEDNGKLLLYKMYSPNSIKYISPLLTAPTSSHHVQFPFSEE